MEGQTSVNVLYPPYSSNLLKFCLTFQVLDLIVSPSITSEDLGKFNSRNIRSLDNLRRISCHGRNHSQAGCEYSLTIFLCCQHHSEYSLLGSKFSTNLLFAASKCHVTIQRRGSSRCSKWPNRMGWLQW